MNLRAQTPTLRLSDFILANVEPILAEWELFAKSLPIGANMTSQAIRNDAERLLRFVAADMEIAESSSEQTAKSQGRGSNAPLGKDTAAHDHGAHRLAEGFDINQMVAEYRALRWTVIRLWAQATHSPTDSLLGQLIRFNEAIDQSIAESVLRFTGIMDHSKDLFLAVLGHDLRNPLSAILLSSKVLLRDAKLTDSSASAVERIERSAERMRTLVADLLDFTRTRMGMRLPVRVAQADLDKVVRRIVEEFRSTRPDREITVATSGNLSGRWDAGRISQLLSNLIGNAIQHGYRTSAVHVSARGMDDEVEITVHNFGPSIVDGQAETIFRPLIRGLVGIEPETEAESRSMGLGLYIAREIAMAHEGTITVTSSDAAGTTFTVSLPRRGAANRDDGGSA